MTGLTDSLLTTTRARPHHAVVGWLLASAALHALAFMVLPAFVVGVAQPTVRVLDVVVLARDSRPKPKSESESVPATAAVTPSVSQIRTATRAAADAAARQAPPHAGTTTAAGMTTTEVAMAAPENTAHQNDSTVLSPALSPPDAVSAASGGIDGTTLPAQSEAPLTPPLFNAAYLRNPPPRYPLAARRNGEQGTVTLRVLVDREGMLASVAIEKTSGFALLDNAAREAVRAWRFAPARRGNQAVEAWVLVPVVFRLEDAS